MLLQLFARVHLLLISSHLTSPHLSSVPIGQVLISMVYLPDVMPASFQATYTPVESAGTDAQIKHLARLMATQMTAAGIGPGRRPCCTASHPHLTQRNVEHYTLKQM